MSRRATEAPIVLERSASIFSYLFSRVAEFARAHMAF